MAVTLVGSVANNCDATTGFNQGAFGTDDAAWEGTGAIGIKASATTVEFYTTSLGGGPYNFNTTLAGYHIILWFNTKTPVNATTGLTIIVGDGTSRGRWNVIGSGLYPGGWSSRVVDTARAFDTIAAGSWTTGGNPAQLTNVTQVGGGFTTTTSIMGSFNNVQIDHITVGLGLRVDGGTVGTPNTFATVRAADESGTLWGWWTLSNGAYVGKGKLYIGPATGSATSVFTQSAFTVTFADELVAADFYEINTRGAGTDVTWTLANISSATTNSRWGLTIQSDTNTFSDTSGVWSRAGALVLNANSTLTGTTIIDANSMTQNGATITDCTINRPNRTAGQAFLTVDDISLVTGCTFTSSGTGHAVDLGTISASETITWDNFEAGYAAQGGTAGNRTILVNVASGQTLTINVASGASTPTYNNTGLGTVSVVAGQVTTTITVVDIDTGSALQNAMVYITAAAGGPLTLGTAIIDKVLTDVNGQVTDTRSLASNQPITGRVRRASPGFGTLYKTSPIAGTINSASGLDLTVQMIKDE